MQPAFAVMLAAISALSLAQQLPPEASGSIARKVGVDAGSGIAYTMLSISGRPTAAVAATVGMPPRLTAVCTRGSSGKLRFELLADVGGGGELVFYPPWKATTDNLYPPRLEKAQVVMEFLGYTKVKPVKREWEYIPTMTGELRYATPGIATSNLEQVMFYLQYLRALPTLRLTVPGKGTVEFETARWQEAVRAEPLCRSSGF